MAHRYAVLLDIMDENARPVGLAVDTGRGIMVDLPAEYAVPVMHDGEYRVLGPGMTETVYRPTDTGYFDQVLVDLFWGFGVGETDVLPVFDLPNYLELRSRVLAPAGERTAGKYAPQAYGGGEAYESNEPAEDKVECLEDADEFSLVAA